MGRRARFFVAIRNKSCNTSDMDGGNRGGYDEMPLRKSELRLLREATRRIALSPEDQEKAVEILRSCFRDAKKIRSRIAVLKTYAELERINSEEHIATMKMISDLSLGKRSGEDPEQVANTEVGRGLEALVDVARRHAREVVSSGSGESNGLGSPLVLPLVDDAGAGSVAGGSADGHGQQLAAERKPAVG